jgi:uncharacterized protein
MLLSSRIPIALFQRKAMISKHLLEMIVCPINHQPLHPADQSLLDRLNRTIGEGTLKDRAGNTIGTPIDEGLVREDGQVLYAIRDGIPVMLADEAIPLDIIPS